MPKIITDTIVAVLAAGSILALPAGGALAQGYPTPGAPSTAMTVGATASPGFAGFVPAAPRADPAVTGSAGQHGRIPGTARTR